jgi:hypothetical protein
VVVAAPLGIAAGIDASTVVIVVVAIVVVNARPRAARACVCGRRFEFRIQTAAPRI